MIVSLVAAISTIVYYFCLINPLIDLKWAYPFALLAMGYRNQTLDAWSQFAAVDSLALYFSPMQSRRYNTKVIFPYMIFIIYQTSALLFSSDFNYEVVRKASFNFRFPVVIRFA